MFHFTKKIPAAKDQKKSVQRSKSSNESRHYQLFFVLCCAASLLLVGALPSIGDWLRDSRTLRASASSVTTGTEAARAQTVAADSAANVDEYPIDEELPMLEFSDWIKHTDPIVRFKLAVPLDWQRQLVVDDVNAEKYDGYAVTYQSPQTSDSDVFSDYIMVEMLADENAGFETDGSWRVPILIDGRSASWERVVLDDHAFGSDSLDLVAYQLLREEPGYSLGIYVVGEIKEEERLREIFTIVIDSFSFPEFSRGV